MRKKGEEAVGSRSQARDRITQGQAVGSHREVGVQCMEEQGGKPGGGDRRERTRGQAVSDGREHRKVAEMQAGTAPRHCWALTWRPGDG